MSRCCKKLGWLLAWGVILISISSSSSASNSQDERLRRMLQEFAASYQKLGLPGLAANYIVNFKNIQDATGLEKQEQFFRKAAEQSKTIQTNKLTRANTLFYQQWVYEIRLNLERLKLERKFTANKSNINENGLFHQPYGKEWYRYFLKEYLSLTIEPEDLKAFGMREVQKVKKQMQGVQHQLGYARDSAGFYDYLNSNHFLLNDEETIIREFERKFKIVQAHLPALFITSSVAPVSFTKIENADENSPPGFYSRDNQKFYFNFYRQRFNSRAIDFLFIHEGIPGHHYQISLENASNSNPLKNLFWYMTYVEGWATYCEELGHELGLYGTPEEYFGKLEWDLVRSARIVMDVGLNYEGWSKEQAMAFWNQHIYKQDEIARREINRMLRWPVQVHSYKVGAEAILKFKKNMMLKQGKKFDLRQFHAMLLQNGPLPLAVLDDIYKTDTK